MSAPTIVATPEPVALTPFQYFAKQTLQAFNTNKTSWIGLGIFLIVVILALFAPWIAPFDPNDQTPALKPSVPM